MKKYFNIFDGASLVTCIFADTCQPASGGRGLALTGCTDLSNARQTVSLLDLTVVEEDQRHRVLLAAYVESYHSEKRDDSHMHFANILGSTRDEAKHTAYEILYRGCTKFVDVRG